MTCKFRLISFSSSPSSSSSSHFFLSFYFISHSNTVAFFFPHYGLCLLLFRSSTYLYSFDIYKTVHNDNGNDIYALLIQFFSPSRETRKRQNNNGFSTPILTFKIRRKASSFALTLCFMLELV